MRMIVWICLGACSSPRATSLENTTPHRPEIRRLSVNDHFTCRAEVEGTWHPAYRCVIRPPTADETRLWDLPTKNTRGGPVLTLDHEEGDPGHDIIIRMIVELDGLGRLMVSHGQYFGDPEERSGLSGVLDTNDDGWIGPLRSSDALPALQFRLEVKPPSTRSGSSPR